MRSLTLDLVVADPEDAVAVSHDGVEGVEEGPDLDRGHLVQLLTRHPVQSRAGEVSNLRERL